MSATLETTVIDTKIRELCEAILADPNCRREMEKVERFLGDDRAREGYREASQLGQALQQKRRQGLDIAPSEIAEFERQRESLIANPVVREFLDAQESLGDLPSKAGSWVQKTIELGRLPEASDFESGCCGGGGGGCGCSH